MSGKTTKIIDQFIIVPPHFFFLHRLTNGGTVRSEARDRLRWTSSIWLTRQWDGGVHQFSSPRVPVNNGAPGPAVITWRQRRWDKRWWKADNLNYVLSCADIRESFGLRSVMRCLSCLQRPSGGHKVCRQRFRFCGLMGFINGHATDIMIICS